MEIPAMITRAERYFHIGRDEGSPIEHLIIRVGINPVYDKEKYFITNRLKEVAEELELDVAPTNIMGTGDHNWFETWMQFLVINDTYSLRNRR